MLQKNEKAFFMYTAIGASRISECGVREGALLVKGHRILSYGYNRKIIPNKEWVVSAALDALFGSKENDLSGCSIFCTIFPQLNDVLLMVAAGISSLYVLEGVSDINTMRFVKDINTSQISFEIIKLE